MRLTYAEEIFEITADVPRMFAQTHRQDCYTAVSTIASFKGGRFKHTRKPDPKQRQIHHPREAEHRIIPRQSPRDELPPQTQYHRDRSQYMSGDGVLVQLRPLGIVGQVTQRRCHFCTLLDIRHAAVREQAFSDRFLKRLITTDAVHVSHGAAAGR